MDSCHSCGTCKDVCPFLAEYGTPNRILRERLEVSFFCTSCHRCDGACPQGLSPVATFYETKQRLIRQDAITPIVRKTLDGARRFAKAGHGFPFSYYQSADTVFWPGCGLTANRPGLVRRVRSLLSDRLHKRVGLVLDCCFDPVHGLGDSETALAALRQIGERLRKRGVRQVITGCLNCQKLLLEHLGMECLFILEVLSPECFEKQITGPVYLHHPCPSAHWEVIRDRAAGVVESLRTDIPAAPVHNLHASEATAALCCGNGGGLSALDLGLADRFREWIIKEAAGRKIVTYCTGCQSRFLKGGAEAIHLLELLPGVKPRRTVPSLPSQWANRLFLAMAARMQTGRFLAGGIIALSIAAGLYIHQQQLFSPDLLLDLLNRHPVLAPLIFLALYAIAPVLFLPSIPLTLAAGFFWGPLWGVVFSISGATIGSCLPFFLARHFFQEAIQAKVPPERWAWLQDKVARHGWKAVAFTRLVPVFPFNLLNYLFGLTPIPFGQYLGSTFAFMLPACIAFVAFGSSLGEFILRGNVRGVLMGVVIAVIAFSFPMVLRPFFRKIGENKREEPKPPTEVHTEKEI
jgi:uncharacterized membrane protein YdjX (TVP38/TMEM64 family)/Fe-S oxidoreductase